MKVTLKKLRDKIEGEVLVLSEHTLRGVNGGLEPDNQGATPSCCPCADDCQD